MAELFATETVAEMKEKSTELMAVPDWEGQATDLLDEPTLLLAGFNDAHVGASPMCS